MNLFPWRRQPDEPEERDNSYPIPLQEYVNMFYQGIGYQFPVVQQTLPGSPLEGITDGFSGLIQGAFRANGIVFACLLTRQLHFCEARFQYRTFRNGRPGPMFGDKSLQVLERPWPNGTTGDLLARMIQDVDLAGNFYAVRQADRLVRLRPDWVQIVLGSKSRNPSWEPGDPDTELIGYQFNPGGLYSGRPASFYLPEQVAHFAPIPDPLAYYRGMSWLTPVILEIQADQAMSQHRQKFFEKGATVNHVVQIPAQTQKAFEEWVEALEGGHRGVANAYKTVYLGAGADMKAIGSDMQQLDFKAVQGAGEVRIATAARIPATILGISEGLQGSTLNAGNYASARRNFADGCLRPLWRMACGALSTIIQKPYTDAELWYDDRDIAFLREDVKDAAEIRQADAASIRQLLDAGYKPDAVIDAVISDDFSRLSGQHSGLFSVQLQPPGTEPPSGGTASGGTV